MIWFAYASSLLLVLAVGFYLITNLQWYSYKLERVVFHHAKLHWHLIYFLIPLFAYYLTGPYFWIYFYFAYLPSLFLWHRKQDKKLVFTGRVKRFFALLALLSLFANTLCLVSSACVQFALFLPLLAAVIGSFAIEKVLFGGFKLQAKRKLERMPNLVIVGITASYGKTSIKHFLAQLLGNRKKVYATPRSINTFAGILKNINEDLPEDCEIYIAEMGARNRGDIWEITRFLKPQYAIVGVIGPQHIEYFKTLENIRNTKMEITKSPRLEKAWIHESAHVNPDERMQIFGPDVKAVHGTLEGITFNLQTGEGALHVQAPLLGTFNATNLAAALHAADALGLPYAQGAARCRLLKPFEHRLQRIDAGGKIILDDSFNGNFEGMLDSFALAATHPGRKILITPGLVESNEELNRQIAERANEVFDLVIVTGALNQALFRSVIDPAKRIALRDKSGLEALLAKQTGAGDLVLFANDAPSFL